MVKFGVFFHERCRLFVEERFNQEEFEQKKRKMSSRKLIICPKTDYAMAKQNKTEKRTSSHKTI